MRWLALLALFVSMLQAVTSVHIGVLAHRGEGATLKAWEPTARYLSEQIEGYHFEVVPLAFEAFDGQLRGKSIDFLILNSAFYVEMEYHHGISRIATLQNLDFRGDAHTEFGSAVFVPSQSPITRLTELKNLPIAAVDPISFGGWLMALRAFNHAGVRTGQLRVQFEGTHDQVVLRVLSGEVEAGVVRSDTLEQMAQNGTIDLAQVRVIEPMPVNSFPFLHTTPLYPEWPFARAKHTPADLAEKVAIALIQMPADHEAASASQIGGWTIPLDYQPVHELLHELRLGPYRYLGEPDLLAFVKRYYPALLLMLVALLSLTYALMQRVRLNQTLATRVEQKTKELQHSQSELSSIAESMGEGLLAIDPAGRLLLANKAAQSILALNTKEIQLQLRRDLFPFDAICQHLGHDQQKRASGIWFTQGKRRYLSLTLSPLLGPWEQKGIVAVFKDVTEHKEAQNRLETLNRTLESKVAEKIAEIRNQERLLYEQAKLAAMAEMMSAVAHHWRQPINNVAVLAQDLGEADQHGELNSTYLGGAIKKIMEELAGLSETIDRFSRFFAPEIHATIFDLHEALEETATLIHGQLKQKGIALVLDLDHPATHPKVMGYRGEFKQSVLNLLLNAKDALLLRLEQEPRFAHPQITLTLKKENSDLLITIEDNGIGIAPNVQGRLFDPYFTTKRRTEGAGIGLYMVKMLIEKSMHGEVKLRNTKEGAIFEIRLPAGMGTNEADDTTPSK